MGLVKFHHWFFVHSYGWDEWIMDRQNRDEKLRKGIPIEAKQCEVDVREKLSPPGLKPAKQRQKVKQQQAGDAAVEIFFTIHSV